MLNQTARTNPTAPAAAVNVAMVTRVTRAQRRAACRQILGGVLTTDVGIIVVYLSLVFYLRCYGAWTTCGNGATAVALVTFCSLYMDKIHPGFFTVTC